jgi:hypothetical protein
VPAEEEVDPAAGGRLVLEPSESTLDVLLGRVVLESHPNVLFLQSERAPGKLREAPGVRLGPRSPGHVSVGVDPDDESVSGALRRAAIRGVVGFAGAAAEAAAAEGARCESTLAVRAGVGPFA